MKISSDNIFSSGNLDRDNNCFSYTILFVHLTDGVTYLFTISEFFRAACRHFLLCHHKHIIDLDETIRKSLKLWQMLEQISSKQQ